MNAKPLSLPTLLRRARKAVAEQRYVEAEELYAAALALPTAADSLDIKLRHAYCAEQAEHLDTAIGLYREIADTYIAQGEEGAAAALEQLIEGLQSPPETEPEPEPEAEPLEVGEIDEEELVHRLCQMGETRRLKAGEVLCHYGDTPEELWIVRRGKLKVQMPDYEEVDVLDASGDKVVLAGEIGFFTLQRRTATLTADGGVEYVAIDADAIRKRQREDTVFDHAMERLLRDRWAEPVLAQHVVFERINEIDRRRLAHAFESLTLEPGETLIEAGKERDGAFMLVSGCMFFMHDREHPAGDDATEAANGAPMTGIFPGDLVHIGGLLRGYTSEYRIVTATPVELLHLPREIFEPFTLRRPWIIQAILRYARRPVHLQVLRPEEDYLWRANRDIPLRRVRR